MLACLSDSGSASQSGGKNNRSSDEQTIDKLVNECLKLKKRNKELKLSILQFEAKEKDWSDNHEAEVRAIKQSYENELSTLKAQHFIELSQLRDYRIQDINDLTRQLQNSQKNLMNQNPMVVTMTDKIKALENTLEQTKQSYNEQLQKLENQKLKSPDSKFNVEKQGLLNRALIAENELRQYQMDSAVKLKTLEDKLYELETKNSSLLQQKRSPSKSPASRNGATVSFVTDSSIETNEVNELKSQLDNLQADIVAKHDEIDYYRLENTRLEKQVALISEELVQYKQPKPIEMINISADRVTPLKPLVEAPLLINTSESVVGTEFHSGIASLASPIMNKQKTVLHSTGDHKPSIHRDSVVLPTVASPGHHRGTSSNNSYVSHLTIVEATSNPNTSHSINSSVVSKKQIESNGSEHDKTLGTDKIVGFGMMNDKPAQEKLQELKNQLIEAKKQIAYQKGVIQELVSSKSKVEEGVKEVLSENKHLHNNVWMLTKECERLKNEIKKYEEGKVNFSQN